MDREERKCKWGVTPGVEGGVEGGILIPRPSKRVGASFALAHMMMGGLHVSST